MRQKDLRWRRWAADEPPEFQHELQPPNPAQNTTQNAAQNRPENSFNAEPYSPPAPYVGPAALGLGDPPTLPRAPFGAQEPAAPSRQAAWLTSAWSAGQGEPAPASSFLLDRPAEPAVWPVQSSGTPHPAQPSPAPGATLTNVVKGPGPWAEDAWGRSEVMGLAEQAPPVAQAPGDVAPGGYQRAPVANLYTPRPVVHPPVAVPPITYAPIGSPIGSPFGAYVPPAPQPQPASMRTPNPWQAGARTPFDPSGAGQSEQTVPPIAQPMGWPDEEAMSYPAARTPVYQTAEAYEPAEMTEESGAVAAAPTRQRARSRNVSEWPIQPERWARDRRRDRRGSRGLIPTLLLAGMLFTFGVTAFVSWVMLAGASPHPSQHPSQQPTPVVTQAPTAPVVPTLAPTATPILQPTPINQPTTPAAPAPTVAPTATPRATATPQPTATPKATATPTPKKTPTPAPGSTPPIGTQPGATPAPVPTVTPTLGASANPPGQTPLSR
jgi:hypothetical protein